MANVSCFQNYQLTASTADTGRLVSLDQTWVGVILRAISVTGTPSAVFKLQWSDDNVTWTDDPGAPIATVTAPGVFVSGKRAIAGFYWRIAVVLSGTGTVVCTAGALY